MPVNHTKFEQRLRTCDKKLSDLFKDQKNTLQFAQKIKAVRDYYNLSYTKATKSKTVEKITTSYAFFVDQLSKVKSGELDCDDAIKNIEHSSEFIKINAVFYNLAKACELIFWTATTLTLWAGIWGIALPLLVIQPTLGVAVGITIVGASLAAANKSISCLSEFKSFRRHDTEYTDEVSLVSFFKPAHQKQEDIAPIADEELDTACCL
jgi:hypothetical protein